MQLEILESSDGELLGASKEMVLTLMKTEVGQERERDTKKDGQPRFVEEGGREGEGEGGDASSTHRLAQSTQAMSFPYPTSRAPGTKLGVQAKQRLVAKAVTQRRSRALGRGRWRSLKGENRISPAALGGERGFP